MDMLRQDDFRGILLLRDWVYTLVLMYGVDRVRKLYSFDMDRIEGGEDLRLVRGFERVTSEAYDYYVSVGQFYPYERLYGKRIEELVDDIDRYLKSRASNLNSSTGKDAYLDMLGRLIDESEDEKLKLKYLEMYGQSRGFLQTQSINIDASQKNIIADGERKKVQAEEVVAKVRKKSIEYKEEQ